MKRSGIVSVLLVVLCIALLTTGCTSSPATPPATTPPSSATAASTPVVTMTTPACPDKLVWDGAWDSAELGMAGNHDLSTAWTKYKDRVYGDPAPVTMSQTCRDVKGSATIKGVNCSFTFSGTVTNNTLSGTWTGSKTCSKAEDGRKFSLTMAADNKSWLGDLYDSSQDPSKFPPNWAGRRTL
jgi:hypothetical protein